MAAPAWVQASPTGSSFSGSTSVGTTHAASGIVSGHVAVWLISCSTDSTGLDITWPAGWTEITDLEQTSDFHQFAAWRRCDGSENGTTATATLSAVGAGTSRMGYWSGCLASGVPVEGVAHDQGNTATASCPAITTSGADRKGLHLISARRTTATTPPTGWTEQIEIGANTAKVCFEDRDAALATNATEAATTRALGGTADWITTSLALRPTEVELHGDPAGATTAGTAIALQLEHHPSPAVGALQPSSPSLLLALGPAPASAAALASPTVPVLALGPQAAAVAPSAAPGGLSLAVGLAAATAATAAPGAAVGLVLSPAPAAVLAAATNLLNSDLVASPASVSFVARPAVLEVALAAPRWLDSCELGYRAIESARGRTRVLELATLRVRMRDARRCAARLVDDLELHVPTESTP